MAIARSGQVTVASAGTAVAGTDVKAHLVAVKAHPDNSGVLYVGSDEASTPDVSSSTGFPLAVGDAALIVEVNNLSDLMFDSTASGDVACWLRLD